MIEIHTHFSDWVEVSKEVALDYAAHLYRNITTMSGAKKVAYINEHYVRGITLTEGEIRKYL